MGGSIRFHNGVDFKSRYRDNVYAVMAGTVIDSKTTRLLGRHIRIRHNNGLETVYGHLSIAKYKRGAQVSRGQRIGKVGSTGRATGPHLHFGIKKNGKSVDPAKYLPIKLRKKR